MVREEQLSIDHSGRNSGIMIGGQPSERNRMNCVSTGGKAL